MKFEVRGAALLLPLLLTSCAHKNNQAQTQPPLAPPIEDTPLPKPDNAPAHLPPPVITVPQPSTPPPSTTASNPEQTPAPPKKRKPSKPAPAPPQNDQAANTPPAEVSAGGGFSTPETSDIRNQTANSIAETEHTLNTISRKLNDQEQKISAQIREFLKQAKNALSAGDVDGAHTLAAKAKVLLDELNQ